MTDREPQPRRSHPRRRGLGLIAIGLGSAFAGTVALVRPDLFAVMPGQGQRSEPLPPPSPITAEPFPTTSPSTDTVTPSATKTSTTPLPTEVVYAGGVPKTFEWTLPNGTKITAKDVEKGASIMDTPQGSFNALWAKESKGACSDEPGTVVMDGHSSLKPGHALFSPSFMTDQLGIEGFSYQEKDLGVVEITTEDGKSCKYRLFGGQVLQKFGSGPGTFASFVTGENPLGEDLRTQKKEQTLFVYTCDETKGFNSQLGTSNYNGGMIGIRVDDSPKRAKKPTGPLSKAA